MISITVTESTSLWLIQTYLMIEQSSPQSWDHRRNLCKWPRRLYTNCQIIQFEMVSFFVWYNCIKHPHPRCEQNIGDPELCSFYASRITPVLQKDGHPAICCLRGCFTRVRLVECRATRLIMQSGLKFYSAIKTCWRLYWSYFFEIPFRKRLTVRERKGSCSTDLRNKRKHILSILNNLVDLLA